MQIQALETSSHRVGDYGSAPAAQDEGSRAYTSPPLVSHRKQLSRVPQPVVPGVSLDSTSAPPPAGWVPSGKSPNHSEFRVPHLQISR